MSNHEIERKLTKTIDELNMKYDLLRNELALDLSICPYIWKVENYTEIQAQAKSGELVYVFSQPFYTHKYGYKLRLLLNPNGDGPAAGTHLSTYIQVMKGLNDAILKWPIEYTAQISVLDQSQYKDDYNLPLTSDFILAESSFVKPVDSENLGWGYVYFLPLDQLKPVYLVDDKIFIQLNFTLTNKR